MHAKHMKNPRCSTLPPHFAAHTLDPIYIYRQNSVEPLGHKHRNMTTVLHTGTKLAIYTP